MLALASLDSLLFQIESLGAEFAKLAGKLPGEQEKSISSKQESVKNMWTQLLAKASERNKLLQESIKCALLIPASTFIHI